MHKNRALFRFIIEVVYGVIFTALIVLGCIIIATTR